MDKFDLEKALAGEKVVNKKGEVAGKVVDFGDFDDGYSLRVLIGGEVGEFTRAGTYFSNDDVSDKDLFMAPKKLSGFVNVYRDVSPSYHNTKIQANTTDNWPTAHRVALIDLSQFEQGHGL
ncbi:MAG: hypothetical protein COA84_14905 [Robiginitomaculum sp.]|nr:MAG: hypothetical protein COA84_14905 [Robiginitomaculum sp.]